MAPAITVGDSVRLPGFDRVLTVLSVSPGPPCFAELEYRAEGEWRVLGVIVRCLTKVPGLA